MSLAREAIEAMQETQAQAEAEHGTGKVVGDAKVEGKAIKIFVKKTGVTPADTKEEKPFMLYLDKDGKEIGSWSMKDGKVRSLLGKTGEGVDELQKGDFGLGDVHDRLKKGGFRGNMRISGDRLMISLGQADLILEAKELMAVNGTWTLEG